MNVSTNNLKITLTLAPLPPIEVDNYSPDSDIFQVSDVETGALELTPDGKSIYYTKQSPVNTSLTLNGASKAGKLLKECLNQQNRRGGVPPISFNANIIIENLATGEVESFLDGRLISGPGGNSYGNTKLSDQTFNFSFTTRKSVGG